MPRAKAERIYQPGDIITCQGQVSACMYLVREGQVEVTVRHDGQEVCLAVHGPGEFFGEMALFERLAEKATARALTRVQVLTVDQKNFIHCIQDDPSLAFRIVQTMSHRIRELSVVD